MTRGNTPAESPDPDIAANLRQVHQRIAQACAAAGRTPDTVTLIAVSKTFPAEQIRAAYAAGQRHFGESYLQEWQQKQDALADLEIVWHFIGPLQSNKTREVASGFDWAHSVDRLKIAQRLSDQRPAHMPPLSVCLQVNISGEDSKSGCAPSEVGALAQQIANLPRLRLRGLMAVPAPTDNPSEQHAAFRRLQALMQQLRDMGLQPDTVSAGMSDDLEAAIEEGSTAVRIGSAIFGTRDYDRAG